jgi:large subunit ribosomal protein L22
MSTMAMARLRDASLAPRKARVIANLIRGRKVTAAVNYLRFLNKAGSRDFFKLLVSAVANAEDQGEVDIDNLVVTRVTVDEGSTLKRWRPRAHGRATRVEKKRSHIVLEVSEPST